MSREHSVWLSSFSVGQTSDLPLGIRLFEIGTHLAELIVDLRKDEASPLASSPTARQLIDQLNRDFGNLREILQNSEPSFAEMLIEPVIHHFRESLDQVASVQSDLRMKCDSLSDDLAKFLDPPASLIDEDFETPF